MLVRSKLPSTLFSLCAAFALTACYDGLSPEDYEFGDEFGTAGESSGGNEGGGESDGSGTGPTTGDPTTGDPTTGDPTTGDPTTGDPTTGDPTTGDPTTGDPTTGGDGDGDTGDPTTGGDGDGDGDPTTGDPTTGDPTTGDPTTGDTGGDEGLPDNNYCNPVSNWDPAWVALELEVIELVNDARAQGGNCGSEGNFPPSGPVVWEPALTCAARVHSKDMADNNYFSHTNQQNNGPGWRLDQAGYQGGGWGENIAAGYGSAAQVVQGWLDSDGHCSNMLNGNFSELGVGYAYGNGDYGHYWTQNFGS